MDVSLNSKEILITKCVLHNFCLKASTRLFHWLVPAFRYLEPAKDLSLAVDDKENFESMTVNKEEPEVDDGKSKVDKASKEEEKTRG